MYVYVYAYADVYVYVYVYIYGYTIHSYIYIYISYTYPRKIVGMLYPPQPKRRSAWYGLFRKSAAIFCTLAFQVAVKNSV